VDVEGQFFADPGRRNHRHDAADASLQNGRRTRIMEIQAQVIAYR
jgi:hypothetical protein